MISDGVAASARRVYAGNCKNFKAQVGFLPKARRDVEVEIVRMLPAVTPGEPRSPTPKRVAQKKSKKS